MALCFVGRQPIFDRESDVVAYDLLYRSNAQGDGGITNSTVATSRVVVDAFVEIGMERIVGSKPVLLNTDRNFLLDPALASVPPDRVTLQVSDGTVVDDELVACIKGLREEGYEFALNGYSRQSSIAGLVDFASMVKLDAVDLDDETLSAELAALADSPAMKIAGRVESRSRKATLIDLGFEYFQGHYLAQPDVVAGLRMPSNRLAVLELVAKINDPDLTADDLAACISMDAALSVRVLRFVNSPLSGLNSEVDSVKHAVVLVGREIIRSWIMLLALSSLDDAIPELIATAFIRAKTCELLALRAGTGEKDSFFTVGLFSLMDVIAGANMEDLLTALPFTVEVKDALLERSGARGKALACVEAFEQGSPEAAHFEQLSSQQISNVYLSAISWANQELAAII